MLIDEQTGTLDDHSLLDNFKTDAELFTANRPKWVGAQEGAAQKQAMS
jgi:hypothetical protein